jgi:hypothetical protein
MNRLPLTVYRKTLTRDFSLVWLQLWYVGEATNPKPWNNQLNQSFPYIVFVRGDDTVRAYYDPKGLYWQRHECLLEIQKHPNFQNIIVDKITGHLNPIGKLLDKKVLTQKNDLIHLFELFTIAYPWFQAMWDATSDDALTGETDVSVIRKFRTSISTFNDDLDNTINRSVEILYPAAADYAHVLTIDEITSGKIPQITELQKRDRG